MSLNDLPAKPTVRQPRAIVKVAGVQVDAWVEWSVDNNTFYQADTFRVSFAVNRLPTETDANWFSSQVEAFVEILAGFPPDPQNFSETDLDSLIYGRIDDIEYDPVSTMLVLTGRDLTAAFIDAKTTIQYQNLTSSQIASQLAISHGLSFSGPTTTAPAGTFYAYDRVSMTDQRSEWDLLTWLAQQEGFQCYVKGTTLYFEPRTEVVPTKPSFDREAAQQELNQIETAWRSELAKSGALYASAQADIQTMDAATAAGDDATRVAARQSAQAKAAEAKQIDDTAILKYKTRYTQLKAQLDGKAPTSDGSTVYELRWEIDENGLPSANVMDLRLSRSLTVAKGITVVVRSWNAKQSKGFVAYYPSKGKGTQVGAASPFGNTQIYSVTRGGLDQAGALAMAQQIFQDITRHEMKLRARLPADNILTQTTMVRLTGTGTAFDQDYFVDAITRSMSVDSGYVMDVSAKNINPESVPTL